MTREALLARKAQLEGELADQRSIQAQAQQEIERLEKRRGRAYDAENALGGAIQDVNYWLGQVQAAEAQRSPSHEPQVLGRGPQRPARRR